MKRSEMIQIILDNMPQSSMKHEAEQILEAIEEVGMLPPEIEKHWSDGHSYYVWEWEDEKETP